MTDEEKLTGVRELAESCALVSPKDLLAVLDGDEAPLKKGANVVKPTSDPKAILRAEIADAKRQRDEAQQQLQAAIAQQNQAQQNANTAQTVIVTANGAVQALEAALKLIEKGTPDATPTP